MCESGTSSITQLCQREHVIKVNEKVIRIISRYIKGSASADEWSR